MKNEVLLQIDKIIDIIYSMDQVGLDEAFISFIDALAPALEQEQLVENSEFNQILLNLQNAYAKRDLVDLADVLLYQIKGVFEPMEVAP